MGRSLPSDGLWKFGRRALVATLLATTTLVTGGGYGIGPALAQDSQLVEFNIPPGPLSQALAAFGAQSGTQISYDATITRGISSAGVTGALTRNAALSRILGRSGLVYSFAGARSVVISHPVASLGAEVPEDAVLLDAVTLYAGGATTEGTGAYNTGVASIARGADSLKEVPQSVTVLTSQALQDQNLTNMSGAMAKAPGIVATTDGTGNPQFTSRGFIINNYQIDNLGTSYDSTFRPDFDMAIYDRLEVLRGAEGLFSAAGEPGGTINLARKRPTDEVRSAVSLAYGSWNNRRLEADIGGPIAFDGRLRGRVVGVVQDREFFYKPADEKKQVLYGILEYDLTPSTTLSAGLSYQHKEGVTWQGGFPTYTDSSQLGMPRDVALNVDWANRDTTVREAFFSAEHRLSGDWTLKVNAMRQRYDFEYMQLRVGGPVDPATGVFGTPGAYSEDDGNHSDAVDLNISGRFDLFGKESKLIAGADWRRSEGKQIRNRFDVSFPSGTIGMGDFPGLILPEPTLHGPSYGWPAWGGRQQGVYARLDTKINDKTHLIFGGRYANYKHRDVMEYYDEDGNTTSRDTSWHWREDGIFTPYAGVTYDLTPDWTAYASLTEIYKPQGNIFAGPPESPSQLDPITGRNFELGVKGEVLDGALNLSAALYKIERKGEAVKDTRYGEDSAFYLPLGKIVSEGLDLEISGEVSPGWMLAAGYTYNRNENKSDGSVYHSMTPKHMFKLWTDYNLPGDFSKWTVGGGVTVKSKHANSGTYWVWTDAGWTQPPYEIKQGGYAIWDAHVEYQIDDKWALALNVNNVFDKTYYATLGTPSGGNWYGEPRNATLTLRGRF